MQKMSEYNAVVIGMSAGGMDILMNVFANLDNSFPLPVIVVQHLHPLHKSELPDILGRYTAMDVIEAFDKCPIEPGKLYIAPADYHLLVERDLTISLSRDDKVNYSRPSIDLLFESAAYVWSDKLIGILCTGANSDGAEGIRTIKKFSGLTIAENPQTAEYSAMPDSAVETGCVDLIYTKEEIRKFLESLSIKN